MFFWFRREHFAEPHTAAWADLGSATHQALYARLDARAYVRELEREVQERGGRLDLLKAAAGLQEGREGGAHSLLL